MSQRVDFPVKFEGVKPVREGQLYTAGYMEIEPGDCTLYRFLVMRSVGAHDFDVMDLPVHAVASVDGPLFPGTWIPFPRAVAWWYSTIGMEPRDSLKHEFIGYVRCQAGSRLNDLTVNPWTARAALLAVLKLEGVIPS
jgi:hypothetical protein